MFHNCNVILLVAKYINKEVSKRIGKHITELREKTEFSIEDIAYMTGFTRNTITAIENGANTDISHLIEIAFVIGIQPMEILNMPFEITPRFSLPPKRLNRNLLTLRINKLCKESDFFGTPKFVSDVIKYFEEEFKIKPNPTHTSVVLKRLVDEGRLKYEKIGRKNAYKIVKK